MRLHVPPQSTSSSVPSLIPLKQEVGLEKMEYPMNPRITKKMTDAEPMYNPLRLLDHDMRLIVPHTTQRKNAPLWR
jgi:hypothetical protein